ncbi:C-terminal binding protein [Streptomyces poriferorum]|uniref:C-terminal binding protein n=1 Tax=Streptomyces poriferorum TaxID=2798799 RepID=A0ABY9J302_9ACTN|nr:MULTISPECIES: C-terminal binding protein [unclassified Streptomyces]MDP5310131.1 C-terminal binding protein [Streptomyces sp. Alt4]WLQ60704.1 C-terminal binding protein [Streptomyces sp. Alt2]
MTRPVAVITETEELDPEPGLRLLSDAGFDARFVGSRDPEAIAAAAHDADALIVGYARVDAALLGRLPKVRMIATMSAGYDMIDTDEAARRGMWVSNLPDSATEDVAVHALAQALALTRRLPQADAVVRGGGWSNDFPELPRRVSELTLGLVGFGRIARTLAHIAAPLFGRVLAHDPHATDWPDGVERADLDKLLTEADVLSLHTPSTPQTRGMVNGPLLARMRPGSILVNASRGDLIDPGAVLEALDSGHLAGAALDVFPVEPPAADDPLRGHPRLLLSPHSAFLSDASLRAYATGPAHNVIAWWNTGRPKTPVVVPDGATTSAPRTAGTQGALA